MLRVLYGFIVVCLATVAAHALDVSVVDGQSRVTGTLNQLQSQVADLESASRTHAESLGQYFSCSRNSQLYSEAVGGCVGAAPDAAGLAIALGCADGDVIVQEGGQLACKTCPAGQVVVSNGNGTLSCKNPINSCSCPARNFSFSTGSGHAQTISFGFPTTTQCTRTMTVSTNHSVWIHSTGIRGVSICSGPAGRTSTHTASCTVNGWQTINYSYNYNSC